MVKRFHEQDQILPKQNRYAEEYVIDLNMDAAYARAGYKGGRKNAYHLHNKPAVQRRIAELQAEKRAEARMTIEKVEASLSRIARDAEREGRFSAAIRAWELLGKYLGMFDQRVDVTVHNTKSEEELDAEILRLSKLAGVENVRH